MDSLKKLLWEHEGRDAWQIDASGVDKFVTKETLANGRELISVNPEFYREYKKWLWRPEGTKAAKDAMPEIARAFDEDLVRAHNRMANMSEMSDDAIREFRQSIGHVPNYFPHHRYGNYRSQAKIGDEVVFRQHFDALNTGAVNSAPPRSRLGAKKKITLAPAGRMERMTVCQMKSSARRLTLRQWSKSSVRQHRRLRTRSALPKSMNCSRPVADVLKARGWARTAYSERVCLALSVRTSRGCSTTTNPA